MNTGSVLFVDDDEQIIQALKRAVKKEPYISYFTCDVHEAFVALLNNDISVIVSDLNMPGINGLELLKQVEKKYPDIIRIVLSGSSNSERIISAINQGSIYRYILKPWNDDELKITIRHAVDLAALQGQKRELLIRLERSNAELEQKVVERTRQLLAEANNAEIGKYASQLVHNLNNALNVVAGNLELIHDALEAVEPNRQEIHDYCNNAKQGADYLGEIIASILLQARNESETFFRKVDINRIILSQLRFFELNTLYKYKVNKNIDLAENLPMIMADAVQMKQVVGNLVKNAIDAMEETEEKTLIIRTVCAAQNVEIQISDTGSGIAPENLAKLFLPDFTTKPVGKGTGLGLSSVREMLDKHSGKIEIRSEPGRGTQVTILLPAASEDNTEDI